MKKTFTAALLATASLAAPALADDQTSLASKWTAADKCVMSIPEQMIVVGGVSGVTLAGSDLENLKTACEKETQSKINVTRGMTELKMYVK